MISNQILSLRKDMIEKIRAYAKYNLLKAYKIARIAGISETAERDFESEHWNPLLETLISIKSIVPTGWEPQSSPTGNSKAPLRAVDLDPESVVGGRAGRLSIAHQLTQAFDRTLTPELMSKFESEHVSEFATVITRSKDGDYMIRQKYENHHMFGCQYCPVGLSVRDKPDKKYGVFVADRMDRYWASQEPLVQHVRGQVKGGRLLNSWIMLLPVTTPDSFGPDTILSIVLLVWERRELGLE
jgi:hypothetical protein